MSSSRTAIIVLAAGASTRLGQPKQLLQFRGRSLLRHAAETALASACRPVIIVLGAHAGRMESELASLPLTTVVNPHWERGIGSSIKAGIGCLLPRPERHERGEGKSLGIQSVRERNIPIGSSSRDPHVKRGKSPPSIPQEEREETPSSLLASVVNLNTPPAEAGTPNPDQPTSVIIMLCDQPLITTAFLDQMVLVHATRGHGIVAAEYNGTCGVPALFSQDYFPELATLDDRHGAKNIISKHPNDLHRIPFPDAAIDIDTPADLARFNPGKPPGIS